MNRHKRLRKARKVRIRIASELHELESGRFNVRDVIGNPSDALGRVSIHTLLKHTPKMGEAGIKKTLQGARVWPEDRVAHLSKEERDAIIKHLPPRVATYPTTATAIAERRARDPLP